MSEERVLVLRGTISTPWGLPPLFDITERLIRPERGVALHAEQLHGLQRKTKPRLA
ncbi:hypothetical protein ACN28E_22080 [Archangium lansingense]|uniref:hypothetical protein n=1 Tax=Archangium lansingense TaxID=2995310 RepID=UPI003B7E379B